MITSAYVRLFPSLIYVATNCVVCKKLLTLLLSTGSGQSRIVELGRIWRHSFNSILVSKPLDLLDPKQALFLPQCESCILHCLQYCLQSHIMFYSLSMDYYIILYLLDPFQPMEDQPKFLLTLTAHCVDSHGKSVIFVQTPGSIEHKQMLTSLVQCKLMICMVHVQY